MKPISSTDTPVLQFEGNGTQKFVVPQNKIGWIRSMADQPGAKFDLTIKDAIGSIRFERKGFGTPTKEAGELFNIPFKSGEQIEVIISNLQGAKNVSLILN